jgi:hypothetical protein
MKKLLLLLIAFSLPTYAGWSKTGSITSITSHNGFHLINSTITDDTCGTAGKFYWPTDDNDAKDMFALALAAYMGGKKVAVVYSAETPECILSAFIKATHLTIKDK